MSTEPGRTLQRSRSQWTAILKSRGIRPERSMGQNFLVDPEVVDKIVTAAAVEPGQQVIEIGPGMGVLTRRLLEAGCQVTGVELDRDLAAYLREDLSDVDGFSLIERDARHVNVSDLGIGAGYHVVANLPYSTATVILRHFLESDIPPVRLTVMVQREVAERMTAEPPDMSLLGLATQFYCDAEIAFTVPPDVFAPAPKVESAVVTLDVRESTPLDTDDRERMFSLATLAFQRRRKTISNGLSQGIDRPKSEVEQQLLEAGIDPMRRPETLTVADWVRLTRSMSP